MSTSACFPYYRPQLENSLLLGEEKVKNLIRGRSQTFPAGTTLIRAGSNHEYVYRLISGWASRTRTVSDGRDQIILVFLPGELFAVKSMFVSQQFDDVTLLTHAVVESIHYRDLYRSFSSDTDVANRCMWQVIEEERRLHIWVFALAKGSAEERLAWALLDFRKRLAVSDTIACNAPMYPMPLTQAQLARHLGITSVHVNRVLKKFRDSGIASVRSGQVIIHDLEKLTHLASPLLDAYEQRTLEPPEQRAFA